MPGAVPGRPDLGPMPQFDGALNSDEDAIASLCRHYGVPLVSMRGGTLSAVRRGALTTPSFMRDYRHPTGQGHTFLAQSALQRIVAPPPGAEACRPATTRLPLPPPLVWRGGDGAKLDQRVRSWRAAAPVRVLDQGLRFR